MTDNYFMDNMVSEETLAAWLDGMMSPEEESEFREQFAENPELTEILDINDEVVDEYESMLEEGYELPEELTVDFSIPVIYDPDLIEIYPDGDYYEEIYHDDYPICGESDTVECEAPEMTTTDDMSSFTAEEESSDLFFDDIDII